MTVLVVGVMRGLGELTAILVMLLLGLASAVDSLVNRYRIRRALVDLPDEEFLRQLRSRAAVPDERLLAERQYVARVFGLPPEKLDPRQTFDELSRHLDYFGSFSVAFNDLWYELEEYCQDAHLESPTPPETVGDLISQLVCVKYQSTPSGESPPIPPVSG